MVKAILKKQFRQFMLQFVKKGRKAKINDKAGNSGRIILYALLFIYVIGALAFMFYGMASKLCEPFVMSGLGWLYFAIMGLISVTLGVVGSVFMTQSQLYEAKDNDLMFSLPVPPMLILFSRLLMIFMQTLLFTALVMIPAYVCYAVEFGVTAVQIVIWIITLILLSFLGVCISCILGWIVAIFASHTRNKNMFTVVLSLAFLGVYFYIYSGINKMLETLIIESVTVGQKIKGWAYLFYQMGLGLEGSISGMLIFTAAMLLFSAIVVFVLTKTYISVATTHRGAAKKKYVQKELKAGNVKSALMTKERRRLFGSPAYLLNCGLGVVFLIAGAIYIFAKKDILLAAACSIEISESSGVNGLIAVIVVGACCMISGMDCITAPSISLEGNTVWLLQSLPVRIQDVMKSKIKLHVVFNFVPALISEVIIIYAFGIDITIAVIMVAATFVFILFGAEIGLMMNLLHPTLNWESDTYAVKQNISLIFTMLIDLGVLIAAVIIFIFTADLISPVIYLLIFMAVIALLSYLIWNWIKTKGCRIFQNL